MQLLIWRWKASESCLGSKGINWFPARLLPHAALPSAAEKHANQYEDIQPIELRLDTLSCFQLAHYGLDLLRRAEPIIASHPLFGHLRLMLKTHWRTSFCGTCADKHRRPIPPAFVPRKTALPICAPPIKPTCAGGATGSSYL